MKGLKGILTLTLLFALSLGITACNNGGSKDKASGKETIKIGVSEVPHGEIVNALKDESLVFPCHCLKSNWSTRLMIYSLPAVNILV